MSRSLIITGFWYSGQEWCEPINAWYIQGMLFRPPHLGQRVQEGGAWHDRASRGRPGAGGQLVGDGGLHVEGGAGMERQVQEGSRGRWVLAANE